MINLR